MNRQGWECPKCGSVWAPHIGGCNNCNLQVGQKCDREKEKALQNQFIQRMTKAEKEKVEEEARHLDATVDPFGPGRMAPNLPRHSYRFGIGDFGNRFDEPGGKLVTRLAEGPYPPGTK